MREGRLRGHPHTAGGGHDGGDRAVRPRVRREEERAPRTSSWDLNEWTVEKEPVSNHRRDGWQVGGGATGKEEVSRAVPSGGLSSWKRTERCPLLWQRCRPRGLLEEQVPWSDERGRLW